uniref:Uncharacterized protein n=1 Tax=viral metagenome TaxID=1070528 RepID=A0A6C0D6P0_9ZZZZ
MQIYYPALIASAIFFASIIVNLRDKNNFGAFTTSLLAIPTVLFIVFLCQKNLDIIAYVLLLVPIILVFVGYNIGIKRDDNGETVSSKPLEKPKDTKVPDRLEPIAGTFQCEKCVKYPCICRFVNTKA